MIRRNTSIFRILSALSGALRPRMSKRTFFHILFEWRTASRATAAGSSKRWRRESRSICSSDRSASPVPVALFAATGSPGPNWGSKVLTAPATCPSAPLEDTSKSSEETSDGVVPVRWLPELAERASACHGTVEAIVSGAASPALSETTAGHEAPCPSCGPAESADTDGAGCSKRVERKTLASIRLRSMSERCLAFAMMLSSRACCRLRHTPKQMRAITTATRLVTVV
mmetsp:Transcript_26161/g.69844  ORF Transcript_26161/g.69844 Transcript_26161/m.69844 type:complete len:228 (-) Transcript_26161:242-925(-)